VARAVGLSRPYLDRLFLSAFGRTVKQEQTRIRMQRIREMLATTHIPAKQIAVAVGFRTLAHMSRAFVEENKVTLRQFRAQPGAKEAAPWTLPLRAARLIPPMAEQEKHAQAQANPRGPGAPA
jgi:AraC-like DNA-binding protein